MSTLFADPDSRAEAASRGRRRWQGALPGLRRSGLLVPVAVFVSWRASHAVVVALLGGGLRETTTAFDGAYYLDVLRDGYTVPPGGYQTYSDVAFFPGLAWVTGAVQAVVRDETAAVLLTANALALAAFVGVWLAVLAWTEDRALAARVVMGLAVLPTSYFLWSYYAEAMLIATTAFAAWAARSGRTWLAVLALFLASTARVVGVAAGPVLAVARLLERRRLDATGGVYVLASAAGFGAVLVMHARQSGDPWAWGAAQQAWGREPAAPWMALWEAAGGVLGTGSDVAWGTAVNLGSVLGVGALLVLVARGWRLGWWPAAPVGLAAAFWLAPLSSRLVSSQVRFALVCWPVLLPAARAWPALPRLLRLGLLLAAGLGSVLLLHRLSENVFTA